MVGQHSLLSCEGGHSEMGCPIGVSPLVYTELDCFISLKWPGLILFTQWKVRYKEFEENLNSQIRLGLSISPFISAGNVKPSCSRRHKLKGQSPRTPGPLALVTCSQGPVWCMTVEVASVQDALVSDHQLQRYIGFCCTCMPLLELHFVLCFIL